MAAPGDHKKSGELNKRKRKATQNQGGRGLNPKKAKVNSKPNNTETITRKSIPKYTKSSPKAQKKDFSRDGEVADSKKSRRLRSKELAEERKKKRKKHYSLEQELALLWEKMRRRNISKEDRSRLISEALEKMKGKISEIACSHLSSRVLQTCVKHCTPDEKNSVFMELRPNFISLSSNTYAVHLVDKMLDHASKEQLAEFISSLHGHVASLLRHMVGSLVVEQAYKLGNAIQKHSLLLELYSPELQLFKDLGVMKENRCLSLADVISKLKLQRSSVSRHMISVLQPIIEKGILDHSIVHRALIEFLSIADQSSSAEILQQLSGSLLVRMIHTKDGCRLAILCIRHGSAKERKKIIKGMKGHVSKIARDKHGSMVLVCILSVVDDTKLVSKIIIQELKKELKELLMDQYARRPFLHLLHPRCARYFGPDDLASLDFSISSLIKTDEPEDNGASQNDVTAAGDCSVTTAQFSDGGKKESLIRRQELLVNSGLAKELIDVCCQILHSLLRSNYGKEVVFEVASGGADGVLRPTLGENLRTLHEAIATLAALPKSDESAEHVLEHFHSSRAIRKLVLECPDFAFILWDKALKGKCASWCKGHSSKVINAYLETTNPSLKELAESELQPLVDEGYLTLVQPKGMTER